MATQRYIPTSIWDDEVVQNLKPEEKYLLLYLFTNPLTNIAGVYKITQKRMAFDTGLDQDTINKILIRFEDLKLAFYHSGYIAIPTWPAQQKYQIRKTLNTGIVAILKELSTEMLSYLEAIYYQYPIHTLCISPPQGPSYSDSDSDSDSDLDSDLDLDSKLVPDFTKETAPPKKKIASPPKVHTKRESKLTPPTLEEITKYCQERNNGISPQKFFDFYTSKGWIVGKVKMKDWKASVRTWENNSFQSDSRGTQNTNKKVGRLEMEEAI